MNKTEAPSVETPQETPTDGASAAPTPTDSTMDPMMGNDPNMDGGEMPMDSPNMSGDPNMDGGDMPMDDPNMGGDEMPMDDPMDGDQSMENNDGDDSTTSIINQLSPEDREAVRAYAQSMLSKSEEPQNDIPQEDMSGEPMMESFIFSKNQLTKIMENFNKTVEDENEDDTLKKKESKTVSKKSPFNSPIFN